MVLDWRILMTKILIAIKEEYAEKIFDGDKKYEYRRIPCKQDIDTMLIYVSSPVMKIMGEAKIECKIDMNPQKLWKLTKKDAGISLTAYLDYFSGCEIAHAYKIGKVKQFKTPKNLNDYGIERAPQSFVYID
jgi:predicted transcriptional regulator